VRLAAACLVPLLLGACSGTGPLATARMPLTLAGTVRDADGPIVGAHVQLTAYQGERCVQLAQSPTPPSDADQQALRACVNPLGEATTDEAGRYTFANVPPGSYDVAIVWTLRSSQPVPADPVFLQGPYAIVIVRNPDATWTVAARSEIISLPDQWAAIQDFTFQPPRTP
jgi:hypothetical protein